jgi:hypothetical protein
MRPGDLGKRGRNPVLERDGVDAIERGALPAEKPDHAAPARRPRHN